MKLLRAKSKILDTDSVSQKDGFQGLESRKKEVVAVNVDLFSGGWNEEKREEIDWKTW